MTARQGQHGLTPNTGARENNAAAEQEQIRTTLTDLHFHQANLMRDALSLSLSLGFRLSHPRLQNPVQQSLDYSAPLDHPVFLVRFVAVDAFVETRQAG